MSEQDKFSLLSKIEYPADLRRLSIDELPELCKQLRQDIIEEVSANPGHLASSLGVIEITVALHYVFDTPNDRIVWDVGHQAYGHKILTGRRSRFSENRKMGGLMPFPSPKESPYDTFTCGHASNSISAALGMAVAATFDKPRHVIAVIGDGAMSGGLAFEGLNNVSSSPNDLLMLDTNETYNRLRFRASRWLHSRGYLNDDRKKGILRFNNALKSALAGQQNIFEGLNIRYFGPYDGHNVKELVRILRQVKDMRGPKLLHLHTVKGKGYKPAERNASVWHAPGRFDAETGERIKEDTTGIPPKFQDVFGHTLLELAEQNPRIVGVTPAMPTGCSMNIMMQAMPERTFDVGIAEGHAVTFSAGMAKDGMLPFCNIYSAFAQRAYDNIIHDVAILGLPVVLCLDRAGLVGEDGATHHGAFDMAALRPVPGLSIASPMDEHELRHLMFTAQQPGGGPFVIRYPRGRGVKVEWQCPMRKVPIGRGRKLSEGTDVAVLSIGPVGNTVQQAIADLAAEGSALSIAHYDMRFLKPLDEDILREVGERFQRIITVEDGVRNGGMGSAVLEWMSDHGYQPRITRLGLPDEFVEQGTVAQLHHLVGIDKEGIIRSLSAPH